MRKRFMEKGAEQGLWNAESFSAESADGEEVQMASKMNIPFKDALTSVRNDPFTLGLYAFQPLPPSQGSQLKMMYYKPALSQD